MSKKLTSTSVAACITFAVIGFPTASQAVNSVGSDNRTIISNPTPIEGCNAGLRYSATANQYWCPGFMADPSPPVFAIGGVDGGGGSGVNGSGPVGDGGGPGWSDGSGNAIGSGSSDGGVSSGGYGGDTSGAF